MSGALFDLDPAGVRPPAGETLSADRRRTLRQTAALAGGVHPLALVFGPRIRLHPEAAPGDDRTAPGLRCGDCQFRKVVGHHDRAYGKCLFGATETQLPRVTHGAATDVRAWWPACTDYEAAEVGA